MPLVFENAWFFDLADAKCFVTATTRRHDDSFGYAKCLTNTT